MQAFMEYERLLLNQGSRKNIEFYFDEHHPELEYEIEPPIIRIEGATDDILFFASHTRDYALLYEDENLAVPLLMPQTNIWEDPQHNYFDED